MATNAQITANQANAQLSTGPRTSTGLENCKHNATKHGLSGAQIVVKGEDPSAYDALRQSLYSQYDPATEQEAIYVEEIAQNFWRLQRARRCEQELLQQMNLASALTDKTYINLERHTTRIERNLARASRELKALQTVRRKAEAELAEIEAERQRDERLRRGVKIHWVDRRQASNPAGFGSVLPNRPQTAQAPAQTASIPA